MKSAYYRRNDCRLCKSVDLDPVLPLAATPVGDAYVSAERLAEAQPLYPLELFLCRKCGLGQLRDVVDPDILYGHFIYETAISLGLVAHFENYAMEVMQSIRPEPGSLVVDIGSNDGTVLNFYQQQGMRVLGVEPARDIARKACDRGIETIADFFSARLGQKIKSDYGPAAIVSANNTFANIDDLDDMMTGIRWLMAPDGVFVMETGYVLDTVRNQLFDTIYHEHLSYFGLRPLQYLFEQHGLELIDVKHIPTKGGSIRVTAQRQGGPRQVAPSVNAMISMEKKSGILTPLPFSKLANRMERARAGIVSYLKELHETGKSVAGYGASVGTTTFLYYLDPETPLTFIADDNPAKYHLFSPGIHVPVLPSISLTDKMPDYVLILAWRYADAIIGKNKAYLDRGGRFIVPWPELEIV